jgi:hypothetical protein
MSKASTVHASPATAKTQTATAAQGAAKTAPTTAKTVAPAKTGVAAPLPASNGAKIATGPAVVKAPEARQGAAPAPQKAAAAKPTGQAAVSPAKNAPVQKAAAKPAAPAPKAIAAAKPTAVPSAAPRANAAKPAENGEKKTRVQLSSVLDISISQARCATHLKQNLGDEAIEAEIKELRKSMKAAKEADNAEEVAELKKEIAKKSQALVRISSETPIAAAVIWDCGIKELLRHGMDQAIANERKIVDVSHLHDGAPAELLYWPLYKQCQVWADYDPEHEEDLKKERALANKLAKEAREAKKNVSAAPSAKPGVKPAASGSHASHLQTGKGASVAKGPSAPVEEPEEDEEGPAEHTKTTFYTYVENSLKEVKKDEPYKSMRVSNRVREYLSELVAQGIARLAKLARIIVVHVMGVRTMNADHVKAIVELLMADEGRDPEQVEEVAAQIDEKLHVYHDHLDTEKTKKAQAMPAEKKAENERKMLEAELNRKQKQAELASKRSADAAQKAQELSLKAHELEPIVEANRLAAAKAAEEAAEKAAAEEVAVAEGQ